MQSAPPTTSSAHCPPFQVTYSVFLHAPLHPCTLSLRACPGLRVQTAYGAPTRMSPEYSCDNDGMHTYISPLSFPMQDPDQPCRTQTSHAGPRPAMQDPDQPCRTQTSHAGPRPAMQDPDQTGPHDCPIIASSVERHHGTWDSFKHGTNELHPVVLLTCCTVVLLYCLST